MENLFHSDYSGEIKIGDFGLSIAQKDILNVCMAGTKGFIAPELEMENPVRGYCNDVFSVAISFLKLLTGEEDTSFDKIENLLETKIENDKIRHILRRGLDQDYKERATASELLELIDESYQEFSKANFK